MDKDTRFVYVCADTDICAKMEQNHVEELNTQSCEPVPLG